MNINILKKIGIITASVIGGAYVLFLASPLLLNPIIKNYIPMITEEINKASGLVSHLDGVKFVTTPKLTTGLKVADFSVQTPQKEPIFSANNFQIKMSLLPIFAKRIEINTKINRS